MVKVLILVRNDHDYYVQTEIKGIYMEGDERPYAIAKEENEKLAQSGGLLKYGSSLGVEWDVEEHDIIPLQAQS